MKILADANPLFAGPLTGVGYYTKELLENLNLVPGIDLEGFAFNFKGAKKINAPFGINEQRLMPGKTLSYPRYLGIDLPLSLFFKKNDYDLVLGTNYLLPPTGKIPNITTVHDLCFLDHPEWVQGKNAYILKKMLPRSLDRSSGLITISKFSADRIKEAYGYSKPILVISIPPKKPSFQGKRPKKLPLHTSNYFLFISTIEPRKNLSTLLSAFESMPPSVQKTNPLIIAGKPGWDKNTIKKLSDGKNKNVIYLDYVEESERNWLYKNALTTVVPSYYEGFGMMTLESLSMGTPVITSDIQPQREILGKSGLYFEPTNYIKLAEFMELMTNDRFRSKTVDIQKKVLNNHSWKKTADDVSYFIRDIIKR